MKDKITVLHCIFDYYPSFSGHGIYLDNLFPFIDQTRYQNKVLSCSYGKYGPRDEFRGIPIYRFDFTPGGRFSELRHGYQILQFLFRHRDMFDILHLHGHIDIYGLLALFCRIFKKKLVMQMVLLGTDDPLTIKRNYKLMALRFHLFLLIDKFLCISRQIVNSCIEAGIPSEQVAYVPQGVDSDRFHPVTHVEKERIRTTLSLEPGTKVVTFVGAIIKRKGIDWLIDAWKNIQRDHANALLLLVGPYQFSDEDTNQQMLDAFVQGIKNEITKNQLNVRMVGRRDDVDLFLKMSDVFVLPSRKEGFGNVIIEAMACGVPPVVTFMDGVALDTVQHGYNGFIANDPSELSNYVSQLLKDEQMSLKIAQNARQTVEERFCIKKIAKCYENVYSSLSDTVRGNN
ncbi:glycosyltransferase family 4 protein [Desulfuromonas sp. AOP6]|uniref:glycosyltransferase family 4 protein n=1 Tax=Desulfuromonas sp. AOP6 TaxID=1566351 RepID=UPI00126BAD3B|nr:glycosyltransferase family 4 protein [Desulfuromonas sp. AOP6]BCA79499.1 glycosyl transferase [Desulfuromonas sp. AOP6]